MLLNDIGLYINIRYYALRQILFVSLSETVDASYWLLMPVLSCVGLAVAVIAMSSGGGGQNCCKKKYDKCIIYYNA